MCQEGKGAWRTLACTIVRPGRAKAGCDYDGQPDFAFAPGRATFAHGLRMFPRDDEHIPDWLRQHSEEAAE